MQRYPSLMSYNLKMKMAERSYGGSTVKTGSGALPMDTATTHESPASHPVAGWLAVVGPYTSSGFSERHHDYEADEKRAVMAQLLLARKFFKEEHANYERATAGYNSHHPVENHPAGLTGGGEGLMHPPPGHAYPSLAFTQTV